jgi:5-methylcytosine-specific restriction endonuclease McrA
VTQHHRTAQWFRNSRKVRGILTPRIAAGSYVPCVNCGRAVQPGQRWDVGHIIDAAKGGSDDLSNLGAAHRHCNRSAGGHAGAVVTNRASRRARRLPTW